MLRRSVKVPFDDDNITTLANWITDVLALGEAKSTSDDSPVQLPDFIVSMVRSLPSDSSDFSEAIVEEIERSFGIEDTARLIRHGKTGRVRKLPCAFKPFAYELALKRSKPEGAVISISEETLRYIQPHPEEMAHILHTIFDAQNTLVSEDEDNRIRLEYLIRELSSLILSNVVRPL